MANVWEVDYNSSLDSSKIRSSTGIAVNWLVELDLEFFLCNTFK